MVITHEYMHSSVFTDEMHKNYPFNTLLDGTFFDDELQERQNKHGGGRAQY